MKTNELRIGNYVADIWNPDIPRQVQSLAKNLCIYGPLRCKYAVFSIPTKEAKLFANKRPEIVSDIYDVYDDKLAELERNFNEAGYYDETVSHYAVKRVKNIRK